VKNLQKIIAIGLILAVVLISGCGGTREDKNLLKARRAIASKDYKIARSAVETVLSENPGNVEAKCINTILNVRDKKDADSWSKALDNVIEYLKPLKADIKRLESIPDPTSDDLDQLELYIRQRNSSAGFAALALAEANTEDNSLLNELSQNSGSTFIKLLLEASKSYDEDARNAAKKLVLAMGDSAIQPLTDEFNNPEPAIRQKAVELVGKLGNPEVIDSIKELVSNPKEESEVIYSAVIALETLGGYEIVDPLKLILKSNSSKARMHAAKLLGMMRLEEAVPYLLPLLGDDNSYAKNCAIWALTNIDEPAIPYLIEVLEKDAKNILPDQEENMHLGFLENVYIDTERLESRRNSIQTAAMTVLANIKAASAIPNMIAKLSDSDLYSGASSALVNMGGYAVPTLIDLLDSPDKDIRIRVSSILSQIGDRRAIEPLISSLKNDSEKDVRANAATALGNMRARGKNNQAVEALANALESDEKTMLNATSALGTIKVNNDKAIEKLIEIASNRTERESVRTDALSALQSLAPKTSTDAMLRIMMADGESAVVRKAAVTVLGAIKDEKAKPALLWINSIKHEEIDDFQRELESRYRNLSKLEDAIDKLDIPWNTDYPQPKYGSWREIKPIPSLVRSEVARTLGKIKGDDVVDNLIESLKEDERASVRQAAAWALGEIKGEKVVDPLINTLRKDERGNVRSECATALDKIGGKQVVKPLLKTLNDDEYEAARKAAAIGLREEKYDFAAKGLVDVLRKGIGKYEEDKEVESILDEVVTALILDGSVAVKPLINLYNSSEKTAVRRYAIHALGSIADIEAFDTMIKALDDKSPIVRERAVALLGNFKQRDAVEPLLDVLNDKNEWKSIRARAIDSLGNLRDERSIEPILKLLDSEDDEIQNSSIIAFSKFRDVRAVPKMKKIIRDDFELPTIKDSAISALGQIGDKNAEDVLLELLNTRLGTAKIELTDRIKTLRENAIIALGKLEVTRAVPKLLDILEDKGKNEAIRKNSATALARIGDERAVNVISQILVDETEYKVSIDVDGYKRNYLWETVVNAARTFDIKDYVAPEMIERIEDDWESYKTQAFATLALGPTRTSEAIDYLQNQSLSDPTEMIRQYAIISLGELEQKRFSELFVQIMKDSEKGTAERQSATQALGKLAIPSTTSELVEIFQDTSVAEEIRRDAAVSLGKIGNEQAVSALIDELSKSDTSKNLKLSIISGLKIAASNKAVDSLKTLLDDNDSDIHYNAALTLFEIQNEVDGYEFVSN